MAEKQRRNASSLTGLLKRIIINIGQKLDRSARKQKTNKKKTLCMRLLSSFSHILSLPTVSFRITSQYNVGLGHFSVTVYLRLRTFRPRPIVMKQFRMLI